MQNKATLAQKPQDQNRNPLPNASTPRRKLGTFWKWLLGLVALLLLLAIALFIFDRVSPWPRAMLIRYEFDKGGVAASDLLEKHVPTGVASILNEQFRPNDRDAYLDVFFPESVATSGEPLPTVFWVHGGAWISGSKDQIANYLKILAARGYTVVGVNYSIAPESQYPTPIVQIHDALRYVVANAERLHIDPDRIVIAGDSAGAHMASQVAAMITDPAYADLVGVEAGLQPEQLKGVLLNCGAYDHLTIPDYTGAGGDFYKIVLWSYLGTQDFLTRPDLESFSVLSHVTANYPPTFLTTGNADFLRAHSFALAEKLTSLGVPVDTLFYPEDHVPPLEHEYQFNLDLEDGRIALDRITAFLEKVTQE